MIVQGKLFHDETSVKDEEGHLWSDAWVSDVGNMSDRCARCGGIRIILVKRTFHGALVRKGIKYVFGKYEGPKLPECVEGKFMPRATMLPSLAHIGAMKSALAHSIRTAEVLTRAREAHEKGDVKEKEARAQAPLVVKEKAKGPPLARASAARDRGAKLAAMLSARKY